MTPLHRAVEHARAFVEDPNPILVKELRATFRARVFVMTLFLATFIVSLVVLVGGAALASSSLPPGEVGQFVFQIFFVSALLVTTLIAPAYAATALTLEKETGTYEAMLLTGMTPTRIVLGKFMAYAASTTLVLVAFAPVAGIAFFFGGVSPVHVILGYVGLFVTVALAVSLGLAVSAHVRSTRVATLFATVLFGPPAFFGTLLMTGLGEVAIDKWGTSMHGPFWFAEAIASGVANPQVWLLVVVFPTYVFGSAIVFLLIAATAAVKPPSADRSTPYKVWALFSAGGLLVSLYGLASVLPSGSDGDEVLLVLVVCATGWQLFHGLLFANEPMRVNTPGPRVLRSLGLGPTPDGTARFAALLIVCEGIGIGFAAMVGRYVPYSGTFDAKLVVAIGVVVLGSTAVSLAATTFASFMRAVSSSGAVARFATLGAVAASVLFPFMAVMLADFDAFDHMDKEVPVPVMVSSVFPIVLAVNILEGETAAAGAVAVIFTVLGYGVPALSFYMALVGKVRRGARLLGGSQGSA